MLTSFMIVYARYHIEVTVGRDVLASLADHDARLGFVVELDRNFMFRPLQPQRFFILVCGSRRR